MSFQFNQVSKNDFPLVSVIIPAYNAENFIIQTLESVISQTYKNLEILVVDDGSKDRTSEIVRSIAEKDNRIILLHQQNLGVAAARNLAIQKSKGEFIAPIDADDIWFPQNIEKQMQYMMQEGDSVGLVYAWSVDIDEKNLLCGGFHISQHYGYVYPLLVYQNFIGNASTILIRLSCLKKVGGYNSQLRDRGAQGCEDWDLYLRIAKHYQIRVVPEYLIGYRQVASSMSRNYDSMAKSFYLVLQSVQSSYPKIPCYIYQWSLSNFYIYLANQSSRDGNQNQARKWLYKAFLLDWSMVLIRPDLYLIVFETFIQFILSKVSYFKKNYQFSSNLQLKDRLIVYRSHQIQITDIERLVRIREFLPSRIYEKIRYNWLNTILISKKM